MGSRLPKANCRAPGLRCFLFKAPQAPSLKIQGNHHGNCLGPRAPSFQNGGLHCPSHPRFGVLSHTQTGLLSKMILSRSSPKKVLCQWLGAVADLRGVSGGNFPSFMKNSAWCPLLVGSGPPIVTRRHFFSTVSI